jgi:hypothetical protein
MYTSYLDAKTFGIGQLITQRKRLIVPDHQRDFSWAPDLVGQLIEDILSAVRSGENDYFIGLIVLLGPRENAWYILDGQQRLATTTMIYSSIRQWLAYRGYEADEQQIDSEFIKARQLGGDYSPRLILNDTNHELFQQVVVQKCPNSEIAKLVQQTSKYSSNRLILEAVETCRQHIEAFAEENSTGIEEQKDRLFRLSSFLENRVECVVLDVSSEANAYTIFETLNARGNELSVLDLVKNYVFGLAPDTSIGEVQEKWTLMSERIEDKNADDFLKVFWTSRFGRIQIPKLYLNIKTRYRDPQSVIDLVSDLAKGADLYGALDDPKHEIWGSYGSSCRKQIEVLSILGNKQIRAPILSAVGKYSPDLMEAFLWSLIVLIVRYQIVGKRRTGALEITCARMANRISQGEIASVSDIYAEIRSLIPPDEEFYQDFLRFSDKKASRLTYFLIQLEIAERKHKGVAIDDIDSVIYEPCGVSLDFVLPKQMFHTTSSRSADENETILELQYRIGNRCLLEDFLVDIIATSSSISGRFETFGQSELLLTQSIGKFPITIGTSLSINENSLEILEQRQGRMADLALKAWPLQH